MHFDLVCTDGVWSADASLLAWALECPKGNESASEVGDIETGACCGEVLPKNDVYTEPPSCDLCPASAPQDGESCSLPDACAPRIIDCFYKCCCYGSTIWAQCDGQQWHVATDCSAK